MSSSISTLLTRNLHDVFGENDPARRRAVIDEIFTKDCVFYDPSSGVHRGRDEIDRVAGVIRATHPDFRYQPIAAPEELGNGGGVQWGSGRPDEAPAFPRTDFIIAPDGRIAAPYIFFDKLPSAGVCRVTSSGHVGREQTEFAARADSISHQDVLARARHLHDQRGCALAERLRPQRPAEVARAPLRARDRAIERVLDGRGRAREALVVPALAEPVEQHCP